MAVRRLCSQWDGFTATFTQRERERKKEKEKKDRERAELINCLKVVIT